MLNITKLIAVLGLVALASGFDFHWGSCPKNIKVQQNFDADAYQGVWYEQASHNTAWVEGKNSRCVKAEYTLNATSGVVAVHNSRIDSKNNKTTDINATAVLDEPSKDEGKLTVTFDIGGWVGKVHGMYWVLGTDYNNYTVVYSCSNHLFFHQYTIWYLGREQVFSSDSAETAFFSSTDSLLSDNGLDPAMMKRSVQTNCDV